MHNDKDTILKCLAQTEYMCLATQDIHGAWVSPVYYAWDDALNLYFISMPDARHMQAIAKHKQISVAIYNTTQNTQGDVIGLQLSGDAHLVTDENDIRHAFEVYFKRALGRTDIMYGDKIDTPYAYNPAWQFVKFTPQQIWLFDSKHYGDHRQEITLSDIITPTDSN